MSKSVSVAGFLLATCIPWALLAAPIITAEPSELAPGSDVKVELRVTIDSPDILALDADIQTLGATTFTRYRELAGVPTGGSGQLIDPQRSRPLLGDAATPIPPGTYAFAELTLKTGDVGDQILIVGSTVVNAKFCTLPVANTGDAIAEVVPGGRTGPARSLAPPASAEAQAPGTREPPAPVPDTPVREQPPAPEPEGPAGASTWIGIALLVVALAVVSWLVLRKRS
jgi:hypothetical protein